VYVVTAGTFLGHVCLAVHLYDDHILLQPGSSVMQRCTLYAIYDDTNAVATTSELREKDVLFFPWDRCLSILFGLK